MEQFSENRKRSSDIPDIIMCYLKMHTDCEREIKDEAISPIRFPPTAIAGVMFRPCDAQIR